MQFFKKKNLILYLALAVSPWLSSCIMDTYGDLESNTLPKGNYRISFDIRQVGDTSAHGASTRASGDLVDGDENEHAIGFGGNFVLYFNESGKLIEVSDLAFDTEEHPDEGNIESRYVSTINVDEDYELPYACLILLNCSQYRETFTDMVGEDKETVLNAIWSDLSADPSGIGRDGDYFTMSNSIYLDDSDDVVDLTLIPRDAIQRVEDPFDRSKVVVARVERMVAKFTLEFSSTNLSDGTPNLRVDDGIIIYTNEREQLLFTEFDDDGIHEYNKEIGWQVEVTGWGMNALETQNHIFRHFKKAGNYFNGWKDPSNYRVYWSEDPHYSGKDVTSDYYPYPWQYLQAVNDPLVPYYQDFQSSNKLALRNFSYNEFIAANNFDKAIYVPENTYDYDDIAVKLDNRADVLAGTHLILTAKLLTDLDGTGEFKPNTVFRDRTRIIYRNVYDVFRAQASSFNYDLGSQPHMAFVYYNWDNPAGDAHNGETLYAQTSGGDYALYYQGQKLDTRKPPVFVDSNDPQNYDLSRYTMKGTVTHGDGRVVIYNDDLSILDSHLQPLRIFNAAGVDVTEQFDHKNILKSMLLEWVGTTEHFVDGKMYYFAPTPVAGKLCGTVRNAWYKMKLLGINTIGTSVSYPDDKIVPDRVLQNQQMINIEVHIFPWHIGVDVEGNFLPSINY